MTQSNENQARRRVDVALGFTVSGLPTESAEEIGRDLVDHLMFAGNPRRAPEAVVFISATEVREPVPPLDEPIGDFTNDDGTVSYDA